jgi:hypothetical protein
LPEIAGGGIDLAANAIGTDLKFGGCLQGGIERGLDQEAVMADGREQMLHLALIPVSVGCFHRFGSRGRAADACADQPGQRRRGCSHHKFPSRGHRLSLLAESCTDRPGNGQRPAQLVVTVLRRSRKAWAAVLRPI